MGEIKINIPADMARKLEQTFPDEDKGDVLLRLAEAEMRRQETVAPANEGELGAIIEEVLRLRERPPYITDGEIRRIRREGRP